MNSHLFEATWPLISTLIFLYLTNQTHTICIKCLMESAHGFTQTDEDYCTLIQ